MLSVHPMVPCNKLEDTYNRIIHYQTKPFNLVTLTGLCRLNDHLVCRIWLTNGKLLPNTLTDTSTK